jgi:potassium-transporting ATPase KdpC subunit
MKENILPALRLTLICILFFCGVYTLLIWLIAQAAPNQGKGETLLVNGKLVGFALEGQNFSADQYFWSRPSAVGYNAAGSAGSNKGPSNPDYLKSVSDKLDSFLVHNPGINKGEIPAEMITASGSGLDPDISAVSADIQVKRIAHVRGIDEGKLKELIARHIEKPFLGMFGPEKINVLKLNIDLDAMATKP